MGPGGPQTQDTDRPHLRLSADFPGLLQMHTTPVFHPAPRLTSAPAQNSTSNSSTSSGSATAAAHHSAIGSQAKMVLQYSASSGSISTA